MDSIWLCSASICTLMAMMLLSWLVVESLRLVTGDGVQVFVQMEAKWGREADYLVNEVFYKLNYDPTRRPSLQPKIVELQGKRRKIAGDALASR